jgi:hypothetical protein
LWDREIERSRGLQVDDQLELRRLYYGQVCRLLTLENFARINADLRVHLGKACPVAEQTTSGRELAILIDCGDGMPRCERCKLFTSGDEERICLDDERTNVLLDK